MDQDSAAAARLAAGLLSAKLVSFAANVQPAAFAAMVYFDCLEAIHAERARRRRPALPESSRT
jgi:hypothetical protein